MLHIRRQFQFITVAFLLVLASQCLRAQYDVEYAHPFTVRALQGKVLGPATQQGVSGVLVEECTSDWKTVIQKAHTDSNGHFALADAKIKGAHYIRLSAPGWNTTMFRVHIKKSAQAPEITIRMSVAT